MSKAKDYGLRAIKSLLLPVVVYLVFLVIGNGRFGSAPSMIVIARQSVMPILISFALACNMSVGMWDFSAGAVVVVSAIVGGNLTKMTGLGIPGLIVFCVLTAVILSAFTGVLYNVMKVPSMVLTIGLVLVYETVTFLIFDGNGALISGAITKLAKSPYCFVVLAVMFGIFYLIFNYTPFGHNVRALGNGQLIARNAGLNPGRTKFISFVFGGIFLGMAAVMLISMKGMVKASGSMATVSTVFDAMMGIFIGLFLTKYCNLAFGVFIGAFTMKMLNAGLIAVGLSSTVRDITSGLFLLLILGISSNQGRISEFRAKRKRAVLANKAYEATLVS
jgi:ribose/xylose/arabinose/galactoside ABC-type transport system permease subunit